MAVLIEGISVVIPSEAIERIYHGGRAAFDASIPNDSYCTDRELIRLGFTAPDDVRAYVEALERNGLRYVGADGAAINIVVVDQQKGLLAKCSWARFGHGQLDNNPEHVIALCYAVPSRVQGTIALPANWRFDTSLTARYRFVLSEDLNKDMQFVRHDNGVDVYRDRRTDKLYYLGRTGGEQSRPGSPP
jgi:hypothetical protein